MKTYEEILKCGNVQIVNKGMDGGGGYITLPSWTGTVIYSYGGGWEHVSVRPFRNKIPSWEDMCKIKDMFFRDDECVVQYHPPKAEYVSNVWNCLHLWKPIEKELPMPPSLMVGIKGIELG